MHISAAHSSIPSYNTQAAAPVAKQAASAAAGAAAQAARSVDGDGDRDGSKGARLDVRAWLKPSPRAPDTPATGRGEPACAARASRSSFASLR